MIRRESTIYEQNIRYNIVESPQYEPSHYFSGYDYYGKTTNSEINANSSSNNHNETIVLAFHSSLICLKIALCVLL